MTPFEFDKLSPHYKNIFKALVCICGIANVNKTEHRQILKTANVTKAIYNQFCQEVQNNGWGQYFPISDDNSVNEWNWSVFLDVLRHLDSVDLRRFFPRNLLDEAPQLKLSDVLQYLYVTWLVQSREQGHAQPFVDAIQEGLAKANLTLENLPSDILSILGHHYSSLHLLMAQDPALLFIVQKIPSDFVVGLWRQSGVGRVMSLWESTCEFRDRLLSIDAIDAEMKAVISDWYVLAHDFPKQGNPKARVSEMHPETVSYGVMEALALLQDNKLKPALKRIEEARQQALTLEDQYFDNLLSNWVYAAILYLNHDTPAAKKLLKEFNSYERHFVHQLPIAFVCNWISNPKNSPDSVAKFFFQKYPSLAFLAQLFNSAMQFPKLDIDIASFVQQVRDEAPYWAMEYENEEGHQTTDLIQQLQMKPLLPYVDLRAIWADKIDHLNKVVETVNQREAYLDVSNADTRIIYFVDRSDFSVSLREQKRLLRGGWSKGRAMTVTHFVEQEHFACERDRLIAGLATRNNYWFYGGGDYELKGVKVIEALIGYPQVYDQDDPTQRLDITRGTFQVFTHEDKRGIRFEANWDRYATFNDNSLLGVVDLPNGFEVIGVSAEHARIYEELLALGTLPKEAFDLLKPVLENISREFPIHSELLSDSEVFEKVPANSRITLRIQPQTNARFKVDAMVSPLEGSKLLCHPGKGVPIITTKVNDQNIQIIRDLRQELENFENIQEALALLGESQDSAFSWQVELEELLTLLSIVHEQPQIAQIEWPEGVRYKVARSAIGSGDVNVKVRTIDQWLSVQGTVKIDEKTQITVSELLDKVRETQGNFVALSETEYVSLTDELRKQLSVLDAMVAKKAAKGLLKVSAFNASQFNVLREQGLDVEFDSTSQQWLNRIEEASQLRPQVPNTLTVELRDYQKEGFEWLSRLSHWGAGALLSDDMGLGKTVQTIALLQSKAKEGASLVVVPTAVLYNWVEEIHRFAPGLNPIVFNQEDREKVLETQEAGDVLLTSYGVLVSEIDRLKALDWNILVLDEAHAIKNRETKTSHAVKCLKSRARVLLTGTPIQNRLSEIWNLFDVANPGFLGTFDAFGKNFIIPIEHHRDRARQQLLKRLIAPFVLRRTKNDVLTELPNKTEMTLRVELSPQERTLYENIRQEAIRSLQENESNSIAALAALTKLRQAACHPKLINTAFDFKSSKTAAFIELVEELVGNKHRALVFSQFTSHLALIREALDENGIEYLYLDGAMSPAQRSKLVDRFQRETMPLFLISLKAGGTGLNLTSADYVIHLDPWWNPAIEDQASDRAYRIGQQRPVSVYRLLAADTIEEKIIELHQSKKSLADALLEGTDMTTSLNKEEILKLIQEAQIEE